LNFSKLKAEWQTTSHENQRVHPQNFTSFQFNPKAEKIQWKVSTDRNCNIYLLDEENLSKLNLNQNFSFLYQKINKNESEGSFEDHFWISQKLFITVQNPSETLIIASFIQKQRFLRNLLEDYYYNLIGIGIITLILSIFCFGCACAFVCTVCRRIFQKKKKFIDQENENFYRLDYEKYHSFE
jgi:hypothetical protein